MSKSKQILLCILLLSILSLDTYDIKSTYEVLIQYQPNTDCFLIKFTSSSNQIVYCKNIDNLIVEKDVICRALVSIQRPNYTGSPDDFTLSCIRILEKKMIEVKPKPIKENGPPELKILKPAPKPVKQEVNELLGTLWQINKVESYSLAQLKIKPTIYFSNTKVIGTNICNNYSMEYIKNGKSIILTSLYYSKYNCGEEENKLEDFYTSCLSKIRYYQIKDGSNLVFFDKLYKPIIFAEKPN